jgi:hypothetical protein
MATFLVLAIIAEISIIIDSYRRYRETSKTIAEQRERECCIDVATMWVARDEDAQLCLFYHKPSANHGVWIDGRHNYISIDDIFPDVTYANSPREVTLILKRDKES